MSNDIISLAEKASRRFRVRRNAHDFNLASRDDIERFRVLLDRGFEVKHHDRSGKIQKAILSFHTPSNSFMLKPVKTSMIKLFRVEPMVTFILLFSPHFLN
jgi:hypothetical protein